MEPHDERPTEPLEADLRLLWDRAGVLLCITDADQRLLAVNRAWTEILGWREDELIGRRVLEFVHPDDVERTRTVTPTTTASGDRQIIDVENRCLHRDGSLRWLQWSAYERGDRWIAMGRDVTAVHVSHGVLQRSERRSRAMLAAMHEGLVVIGPDGRVVEVSDRFAEMLGWTPSELVGRRPPFPWWPPEEADRIFDMLRRALQGDFGSREFSFMRRDGERFPVLVANARLDAPEGGAPSILAFVRDISDLVDARRRLEEAHTVANLMSWEWHAGRDEVTVAFSGLDADMRPGDVLSLDASLVTLSDEDRARARTQLTEVAAGTRDRFALDACIEFRGTRRWIELRGLPITAPDGTVTGVRGTTQDVTPRRARR